MKKEKLAVFAAVMMIGAVFAMVVYANVDEKANNTNGEENIDVSNKFSTFEPFYSTTNNTPLSSINIDSNEESCQGKSS